MDGSHLRVFVSHTSELACYPEGRSFVDGVIKELTKCDFEPVDMQDFPASDREVDDYCISRVAACDIYVGLIGFRYGTPVHGMPMVSYTELEYLTAKQLGMPRLVFLLDDQSVMPPHLRVAELDPRQRAFRDSDQERVRATFQTLDGLRLSVRDALEALDLPSLQQQGHRKSAQELADVVKAVRDEVRVTRGGRDTRAGTALESLLAEHQDADFVGREDQLRELHEFVASTRSGARLITAPAGCGKTALLARWVSELDRTPRFVAAHFFSQQLNSASLDGAYRNLHRQLCAMRGRSSTTPLDREQLQEQIFDLLMQPAPSGLVIVIDGLDEANPSMPCIVEGVLPDGVHVVVSGRADPDETPDWVGAWTDRAERTDLDLLSKQSLSTWMRTVGHGVLAGRAGDDALVEEVFVKTAGLPLHLHYLLDDMVREVAGGGDLDVLLARTPSGFEPYVRREITNLVGRVGEAEKLWRVVALLAVAKGPLGEDELDELMTLSSGHGLSSFDLLTGIPRLQRWLRVRTTIEGSRSFALRQPTLASMFGKALGRDAEHALRALVAWCERSVDAASISRYPLRHYVEHLVDDVPELRDGRETPVPSRDRLYRLANDEVYLGAQVAAFPDEPEIPLLTIQAAMQAATKTDDGIELTHQLLRHVEVLQDIQRPLRVLEHDGVEAAWRRADMTRPDDRAVWYLLIAWDLHESGRAVEALGTLTNLLEDHPGVLSSRVTAYAADALAELVEVDGDVVAALIDELFDEHGRGRFVERVLLKVTQRTSDVSWVAPALVAARHAANGLHDQGDRATAVAEVAIAQVGSGDLAAARETLRDFRASAIAVDDFAVALRLSQAHAAAHDLANATDWTERIPELGMRALGRMAIARRLAVEAGRTSAAGELFAEVRDSARLMGAPMQWVVIYASVARAFAQLLGVPDSTGDGGGDGSIAIWVEQVVGRDGVGALLAALPSMAIDDPVSRLTVSRVAARVAMEEGHPDDAVAALELGADAARRLPESSVRITALLETAGAFARAGRPDRARVVFDEVRSAGDRIAPGEGVSVLVELATAERAAGLDGDADADLARADRIGTALETTERLGFALRAAAAAQGAQRRDYLAEAKRLVRGADPEDAVAALVKLADLEATDGDGGDPAATVERILLLTRQLEEPTDRVQHSRSIAAREINRGRPDLAAAALAVAREATTEVPDLQARAFHLLSLAPAWAGGGFDDERRATVAAALAAVRQIEEQTDRDQSLLLVAPMIAGLGELSLASEATAAIEDAETRVAAMFWIASICLSTGKEDDAHRLLEGARADATVAGDRSLLATLLVAIAQLLAVSASSRGVALEVPTRGRELDDGQRSFVATLAAARARARDGDLAAARDIAGAAWSAAATVEDHTLRTTLVLAALEVWAMPAGFDSDTVDRRRSEATAVLLELAWSQASSGMIDDAHTSLSDARDAARGVTDESRREQLLGRIDLAESEMSVEPHQASDERTEPVRAPGADLAPLTRDAIADALASTHAGRIDHATWALAMIAREQAAGGDRDAATVTAQLIRDAGARRATLRELASPVTRTEPFGPDVQDLNQAGAPHLGAAPPRDPMDVSGAGRPSADTGALLMADIRRLQDGTRPTEALLRRIPGRRVLEEAERFARRGDRDGFEMFVLPAAYYPEITAEMCALIARVYENQAAGVAQVVAELQI